MKDHEDPHTREPTLLVDRLDLPLGISQEEAVAAIDDVLGSIEDTCPECEPDT
ncbi:hypothetical protein [Bradyrhizobium sp. AZCC 2289]|uniref:hypothetical protein n=1 Tax=Bradyrhizobium sp. AZCC 2289 TaxID=3117026 RepID=UPI002FF1D360